MFYVLTGIDGAGKSSVIEVLSKRGMKTCTVTPEFALSSAEYTKPLIDMKPREFFQDMPPLERSTFLSLLVSLTFERHIKPALTEGTDILCDSYWYKYAAKECVINPGSSQYLLSFFESLPSPDKVIVLETEPEVAWGRKGGSATPFEYGGGDKYDVRAAFIDFQKKVGNKLLSFPPSIATSSIKTDRGPEELADHIENMLYA
ncbi:nucleoside/nucleotide kinase family protein [Corynebacterium glyciniphilum]|uniref:hypothetical protein n=1 Tax=Corynebacterium glyciniphilum TaxID=1404244 RepID=UPI00130DC0B7|nr:hypothetical protein [Corynebacterium glyciniphilum]